MSREALKEVQRFDFAQISKNVTVTPQGFLRIPARFTRTGIFTYNNPDGSETREYRPPEEVFNPDSLKTIANSPLTDLHPEQNSDSKDVSPDNFRELAVGWVGPELKKDGDFVSGDLTIADKGMIDAVRQGLRKELSVGYRCVLEPTPGVINGEKYDAIQRNIIGNHVALLPVGMGRAGRDCALRLDSKDAVLNGVHTMGDEMETEVSQTPQAEAKKKPSMAELLARIDSLESQLRTDKKNKDAESADKVPKENDVVTEQAVKLSQLLHGAMSHLGDNFDFKGMKVHDVKKAVLGKLAPGHDLSEKSDEYVDGCYDAHMAKSEPQESALEEEGNEDWPPDEGNDPEDQLPMDSDEGFPLDEIHSGSEDDGMVEGRPGNKMVPDQDAKDEGQEADAPALKGGKKVPNMAADNMKLNNKPFADMKKKKDSKTINSDAMGLAHALAMSASLNQNTRADSMNAQQAMLERNFNAWKTDLTFSKEKLFK